MTHQELINQCFYAINAFKRSRALANIRRIENKIDEAIFNELKMYKEIDNLELALRALQRALYPRPEAKEEEADE